MGRAHLASIAQEGRDAVRAPQAHSQARQITTAGAERCARRVHPRSNRPEPPKARETDPNADPDSSLSERGKPRLLNKPAIDLKLFSVFFNGLGQKQTFASQKSMSAKDQKADILQCGRNWQIRSPHRRETAVI